MDFNGYTSKTYEFFDDLAENNNREWWLAHKEEYDRAVAEPTRALARQLEGRYGSAHVFRPNRDIRFSADKSPYKLNASFSIDGPAGTGIYFAVSAGGAFIGGGLYQPAVDQLRRWRDLFDNPSSTASVKACLTESKKLGLDLSKEEAVKTSPRGWDKTHPEIEYIRLKNAVIGTSFASDSSVDGQAFLGEVLAAAEQVAVWNRLLGQLIGSSALPGRW